MISRSLILFTAFALLAAPAAAQRKAKPLPPGAKMDALPPARIDDALAISGEDIDARKLRSRMTVAVEINGKGPYRFVVDSGADSSVIGQRVSRALALPPAGSVMLNAMTDSTRVQRVEVDELKLGTSTVRGLILPELLERNVGGDGMIGIDALVEQRLMMDFEKRTIAVEDARVIAPPPKMDGEIVVTARRKRGQLILTQVAANRHPIDAVVDTGSEITIGNTALRDLLVKRRDPSRVTQVEVTGVTGVMMKLDIVRVAELKLGSITLRDVPIAFADVPPFEVFGLHKEPSLLLGTDILENFRRISLDFRARRVRFQLKKCTPTGIVLASSYQSSLTRMSSDNQAVCRY